MPEQILHVAFTPEGGSPLIYKAARDVKVTNSAEITAEPGTTTQVGPRLARRLSCQIICVDMDTEVAGQPPTASAQYRSLEALVTRTVTIDARAMPGGIISWVVESVNPGDTLESDNSFSLEVTAVERIGGAQPQSSARATRIQIPRLLPPPNPNPLAPEASKQPTGAYPGVCQIRPTKGQKLNILVANGAEVTGPLGQPISVDPVTGEISTAATRNPRKGQNMVFTARRLGSGGTDTVVQWRGSLFVDRVSGDIKFGGGTEVGRFTSPKREQDTPAKQKVSRGKRIKGLTVATGALIVAMAKQPFTKKSKSTSRKQELPKC